MRIVSLVPSATEMIAELGLAESLVGVTHECDYPDCAARLPKVTRSLIPATASSGQINALVRERLTTERALYALNEETLARLAPDLIVTQALCDVCAVAESEVAAAARTLPSRPRVLNLSPTRLSDVFAGLAQIADAAGCPDKAKEVVAALQERIDRVARSVAAAAERPRVVILEWIDPPFSSGHWNPELVRIAGGEEVIGREGERSRTAAWDEIVAAAPEAMVIACCGYTVAQTLEDLPILRSKPGWHDLPCVRLGHVYIVDGSAYFSRPGPRLVDSLEILAHALHPQHFSPPTNLEPARRLTAQELT